MTDFVKASPEATLLEAVELLNGPKPGLLVIVDGDDRLLGTVSRHDLRKALMEDRDLNMEVEAVMNKNPVKAYQDSEIEKLSEEAGDYLPIIDRQDRVIDLYVNRRRWKKSTGSKRELLRKLMVSPDASIKKVVNILDTIEMNIVLVVDSCKKFLGLVTERDVRKAILEGQDIETAVEKIMNRDPVTGVEGMSKKEMVRQLDSKIELSRFQVLERTSNSGIKVPILDEENRLRDLMFLDELESGNNLVFISDDETLYKSKVKNILITGGAGYIGSILSRKLLERGYQVSVLDNLLYGDGPIRELYRHPGFRLIQGDDPSCCHCRRPSLFPRTAFDDRVELLGDQVVGRCLQASPDQPLFVCLHLQCLWRLV